jgi:hypothetical protein
VAARFSFGAFQNYAMDSRLRWNDVGGLADVIPEGVSDVGGLAAVIPAKAGIYCKTIQHLCFALYTT